MSNLMVRLTTAIVALPLLTYLILLGGIPFTILIAAAVTIALHEFNMMMMARGFKPVKTVTYILGVLLVGVAYFSWLATDLVKTAGEHPAFTYMRTHLPGPLKAVSSVDIAVKARRN